MRLSSSSPASCAATSPAFASAAQAYKNLISGAEPGANQGVSMPVLAAATGTDQTARLRDHGEKDTGAMVRV